MKLTGLRRAAERRPPLSEPVREVHDRIIELVI